MRNGGVLEQQPISAEEAKTVPGSNRMKVGLALLAVYSILGSTYFANRVTLEGFPAFLMAGIRFIIAGGGFYLFLRKRGAPAPSPRQWLGAATVGGLLLVGGNGLVVFAEQWVAS